MSDNSEIITNVLLPTARVALFVRDKDMREAAASLKDDWRFARVTFDIHDGDVASATEYFRVKDSPNLLFVETEEIGDGFTDRLEVLAGSCSEHTAAVVVGPINDVYLYRQLIDMGVSDYLVCPISKTVLTDLIAKILIEKLGSPGSRLVAFVGAKGGVGTSTMAQACALSASTALNQKSIILDAAGGRSYLSVAMGTEAMTTLHEATRVASGTDQDSFKRMIVKVDDYLSVLATGAEAILDGPVASEQYEALLSKLMVTFPLVICDLSQAPTAMASAVLVRAHEIVVVTSPSLPSLRAARSFLQEIKTLRGGAEENVHLVLNQKGMSQGFEISDSDIETALKIHPEVVVPWAPKVFGAAETSGKPLTENPAAKEILGLMQKFLVQTLNIGKGDAVETDTPSSSSPKILGGILGKLKK